MTSVTAAVRAARIARAGRVPAAVAAVAALAVVGLGGARAAAEPAASPGHAQRTQYIAGLLEAIAATDDAALANTSNYIYVIERNSCQAADESLRVGCLLTAAARNCATGDRAARERCSRVSDVIVTNRLGETAFLPEDVRYELLDSHRDYRTAAARELHRRYAILVAELAMSRGFPGSAADSAALAAGIDDHCRAVAGTRELSWQYCAAAIVWFIATDGRGAKPVKPGKP